MFSLTRCQLINVKNHLVISDFTCIINWKLQLLAPNLIDWLKTFFSKNVSIKLYEMLFVHINSITAKKIW